MTFCSALRADFLFKCGWRDRCRSLEWIECWRLQDFRFGFLECLCFSVFWFLGSTDFNSCFAVLFLLLPRQTWDSSSLLHARWSVLLSQHCSHIRLLYPPSLYIRLRTCPSKLHTCTGPESPKSSFQIHTFTCFKGRNPWSLLSFSFAYSFFNFLCFYLACFA